MSGGSYNYLCYKDASMIWDSTGTLSDMAQRLAGLGYAADAAAETESLLLLLRQAEIRIQTRIDRLSKVWRAVEWWDSGDSGEDGLKQALSEYRSELEAPPAK